MLCYSFRATYGFIESGQITRVPKPEVQGFFGGVGRGGSVTQPPFWGPRLRLPEFAQIGHMDL